MSSPKDLSPAASTPPEAVGYAKPPTAHRFKPGQSGNPTGRVKGVRNLRNDLADELAETIIVQEGGVAAKLTKQRAFVKRLCAKALSGDPRAMAQLAQLTLRLMPQDAGDHEEALSMADKAILARVLARVTLGSDRKDHR